MASQVVQAQVQAQAQARIDVRINSPADSNRESRRSWARVNDPSSKRSIRAWTGGSLLICPGSSGPASDCSMQSISSRSRGRHAASWLRLRSILSTLGALHATRQLDIQFRRARARSRLGRGIGRSVAWVECAGWICKERNARYTRAFNVR